MKAESSISLEPWRATEDKAIMVLIKEALDDQHEFLSAEQRRALLPPQPPQAPQPDLGSTSTASVGEDGTQTTQHLFLHPPPVYAEGCVLSTGSSSLARSALRLSSLGCLCSTLVP